MQTLIHFYLFGDVADKHLPPKLGKAGSVWREVLAREGGEIYSAIGRIHCKLKSESPIGKGLMAAWSVTRHYSKEEVDQAQLFHMGVHPQQMVSPSVETVYDLSNICPHCGAGRRQVKPLEIKLSRLPRNRPVACTLKGEWLVPANIVDLLQNQNFTGLALREIKNNEKAPSDEPRRVPTLSEMERFPSGHELLRKARQMGVNLDAIVLLQFVDMDLWRECVEEYNNWLRAQKPQRTSREVQPWFQLEVVSKGVTTCKPTKFGIDPFDDDTQGTYRCPVGHTSGLNLLSAIHVCRKDWDGSDVAATSDLIGYPPVVVPMLLVSPRLRKFWVEQKARGVFFDVAHIK
jgi:hypothetical protein